MKLYMDVNIVIGQLNWCQDKISHIYISTHAGLEIYINLCS
jgi:hypothetical protein